MLTTLLPQQERGHRPRGPPSTAPPQARAQGVPSPGTLCWASQATPALLAHRPITQPPLCSPPRTLGSQVPQLRPLLDQSPDPLPGATPSPQAHGAALMGKLGSQPPKGGTQGTEGKVLGSQQPNPGAGFQLLLEVPFYTAAGPLPQGWGHIHSSAVTTETGSPALMSNPRDNDSEGSVPIQMTGRAEWGPHKGHWQSDAGSPFHRGCK